ncbi:MAG: hypothetical protein AAF192_21930 [Pseudomonadota bacterium]
MHLASIRLRPADAVDTPRKPAQAAPKRDPAIVAPIKTPIENEPSFACRTVAWLPA